MQIGSIGTSNLHFANDTALLAESPSERQVIFNRVEEASENLGIKVSIDKTEIQYTGRANKDISHVCLFRRKPHFKGENYFRPQEANSDSRGLHSRH